MSLNLLHLKSPMLENRKPKFTIEELMQLKRGERPSPEFWDTFERELHIKQRKLLQQQPVDESTFENEFWRRFKRITAICTATVSCGAFGFIVVNTLSTTAKTPQPQPEGAVASSVSTKSAAAYEAPRFEVAVNESSFHNEAQQTAKAELAPAALSVPTPKAVSVAATNTLSPEVIAAAIDEEVPLLDLAKFRTEFETFDPEKAVASLSASKPETAAIVERYVHPLDEIGHQSGRALKASYSTIERISNYARNVDFFDRGGSSDMTLDAVSLKF